MRWMGEEQSNNVEVASNEERPYGSVSILRNLKTGIVSSIDPIELNNTCRGVLNEAFAPAAKRLMYAAVHLFEKTPNNEPTDCKTKVDQFKQEAGQNGLVGQQRPFPEDQKAITPGIIATLKQP